MNNLRKVSDFHSDPDLKPVNISRAYATEIFTLLAGTTKEQITVRKGVLARSPPRHDPAVVQRKDERTIQVPEDKASHVRCLVAFLYMSHFRTDSKCELKAERNIRATIEEIEEESGI